MGKLLTALRKMPKHTSALAAMIATAVIVPAVLFAWGPDRPTYTIAHPADHVTFNSITDNPNIGDERNFVGIRESGTNGTWSDNMTVQPGKEYVVRMYVHNNAASNLNLVAKDVTAKFFLPTNTAKSLQVNGFLDSSNASPTEVYDHAIFSGDQDFNLAYKADTLKYYNNYFGSNGVAIPESVFTSTGARLGYDKLDGNIPGCFQYAGYLTFIVKPQFASAPKPDFTINKQVRKDGDKTFAENVDAKAGDKLNYRITYTNTGETQLNNVILKDTLPKGIKNVPGSVRIMNANNPSGAYIQDGDKLFSSGINIGTYTAGSNALVIFDATVDSNDNLPTCGANVLHNIASAQPEGQNPKEDGADTHVPKECQTTPPCYSCDALTVTKIDRTNFKFDTKYTVKGAAYKSTTYVIRDEAGKEISRSTNATYVQTKPGKYTVEAIVTVTINGVDKTISSEDCKKPFEVTEIPATPVYTCDTLVAAKISRTDYTFTGTATAKDGATITSYAFNFGDGSQKTVTNPKNVAHSYTKAGNYTATLSVAVKVNGTDKIVTGEKCSVQITVSPEECKPGIPTGDDRCIEKCTIPGKETLPKDSPDCKELPPVVPPVTPPTPPELPHTGTGDPIIALIGAGALIAAIGYYTASRRALTN